MTEEQLKELCNAIKWIGDSIAEDAPLNLTVARGLEAIADNISLGLSEIAQSIASKGKE